MCSSDLAISPAVAQLTSERNRTLGFSLLFARGIGTGVVAGILGGRLPGWLLKAGIAPSPLASYRYALLAGSAMVLLALWPLAKLRLEAVPSKGYRLSMPNSPLRQFLGVLAVWHLGTALFNPFFNAFLTRQQFAVARIGTLVSISQTAQVSAILFAPLVFRACGRLRGIAGMQFVTALALLALAAAQGSTWVAAVYVFYMAAQFMSEPGLYGYLMDVVPSRDRGAASALNFLVAFAVQAAAAGLATAMKVAVGVVLALCAFALVLTTNSSTIAWSLDRKSTRLNSSH